MVHLSAVRKSARTAITCGQSELLRDVFHDVAVSTINLQMLSKSILVFTARRVCIARTRLSQDVCPVCMSVRHSP